jgi:sulfonate transport system substrate-binding protein
MSSTTRRSLLLGASALGIARTARAATTLRIGDQRGNMRAVLEAASALRGVPYDISWVEFPAAAPLIEALNAQAIELGVVGDAPFTFGFAAGVPMRVIAARRSTQQGLAIVVPGNSPAHTLADLEGKRIATGRGSIGHFLVLAALRHAGMPIDAVKLVFLLPADAAAALASGSVDAWSTWEPYTSQVEVIQGGRQIVNGVGIAPGQGFQIASLGAIASKHDQLSDFLTRLTIARRWANAHVNDYAKVWAKLMGFPESVPQHWFARTSEEVVLIDQRAISDEQKVIDLYSDTGLLRTKFTAASAFDASFNAAIRRGQMES